MNQTGNYQLNQWELADRIQMEDFNGDNSKIDAALKGQAEALAEEKAAREAADAALAAKSPFVKLKELTVPQNMRGFTVDVSDIDWAQWQAVYIDCDCELNAQYAIQVNSTDGPTIATFGITGENVPHPRVTLEVGRMPRRFVAGTVRYENLTALVYTGNPLTGGSKVTLWGVH